MILYPNAKINIGLNIIARRPDGYHELESVMFPVPLFDILELTHANTFEFVQTGLPVDGNPEDNLCVKTWNLMRDRYELSAIRMHLRKQIPMGGGLGGGSADVGFLINGINELFQLELSLEQRQQIAAEIGSDCPFFIANVPQLAGGRGEVLTPILLNLKWYYLKIVNPGIHISTKEAFSQVHISGESGKLQAQVAENPKNWKGMIKNDFEQHLFVNYHILEEIKQRCYNEGAVYAAMSGSGSTLYALYHEQPPLSFGELPLERIVQL